MKYIFTLIKVLVLIVIIFVGYSPDSHAQKLLNKQISITANRQPVSEVLKTIGEQGAFYFSYNSDVIPGDSIVTIMIGGKSVRQVLDVLLTGNYQYKETGNYIILQKAPAEKFLLVSGQITDNETGKGVDYVSVYSKALLVSTLSEDDGSFRLKVKDRTYPFEITISKIGYADTSVVVRSGTIEGLKIGINPKAIDLDEVLVSNSGGDRIWLARLFVSSRLRAQSRNIGKFFVSLPYQASLTPGLGTHGRMSSQITNKFSLNLLGGYSAGVNGVEIAGGFNISKRDVKRVQLAGVFNIVSGKVNGLQVAGLHNHVIDSLSGIQVAGFSNIAGKPAKGVQVSGFLNKSASFRGVQIAGGSNLSGNNSNGLQISSLVNHLSGDFKGVQITGALNVIKGKTSGLQLSGLGNIGRETVRGLQLGPFNFAKNLKGTQIGIINIADSTSGYSLGIFNFIKNGTSNISVYANDIVPVNLAWKTGSKKNYTILLAGSGIRQDKKAYTLGMGLGKEFRLNKNLGLLAEITNQTLFVGKWENAPVVNRLQTALNLKLIDRIRLFAGLSFTMMNDKESSSEDNYLTFPPKTYANFDFGGKTNAWLGWQAGLSWRYGKIL